MEEEYGAITTPAASATNDKADDMHHSQTNKSTPADNNSGAVMIEEDVIESAN